MWKVGIVGKVHPRTCHEGPDREQRYGSTLSLTLALDRVGDQRQAPVVLPPGKRPGTHRIGDWVGLSRSGRMREISPPTGIRSPDRPACSESLYRLSHPGFRFEPGYHPKMNVQIYSCIKGLM
jgi:hypothetical protein